MRVGGRQVGKKMCTATFSMTRQCGGFTPVKTSAKRHVKLEKKQGLTVPILWPFTHNAVHTRERYTTEYHTF